MSFFSWIREQAGRAGCGVGLHAWTPWTYTTDGQCDQTRRCRRCGKEQKRVEHTHGEWEFDAPRCCDQTRTCTRDGHKEHRTEHAWGTWLYAGERSCDGVRRCARCYQAETKPATSVSDHITLATDLPLFSCYLRAGDCPRCGTHLTLPLIPPEHTWGEWKTDGDGRERRECRKCGDSERRDVE